MHFAFAKYADTAKCICILHSHNIANYAVSIQIEKCMDLETQVTATAPCIRIYIANASRAVVID